MRLSFPVSRIVEHLLTFGEFELVEHSSCSWQSATFEGTRHELTLRYRGEADVERGSVMIDALDEELIDVPGHKVTEIRAVRVMQRASPALLSATMVVQLLKDG